MKRSFLIGALLLMVGLLSFQKVSDVRLFVETGKQKCLQKGQDIPVKVVLAQHLQGKGESILSGTGITFSVNNDLPKKTGERNYIGRTSTKGDSVFIVVSYRDNETQRTKMLYKRSYCTCSK